MWFLIEIQVIKVLKKQEMYGKKSDLIRQVGMSEQSDIYLQDLAA